MNIKENKIHSKGRILHTCTASHIAFPRRKNAAACSKRCLPRRAYAFFSAAFLHLSWVKSLLKKVDIFWSRNDLDENEIYLMF